MGRFDIFKKKVKTKTEVINDPLEQSMGFLILNKPLDYIIYLNYISESQDKT